MNPNTLVKVLSEHKCTSLGYFSLLEDIAILNKRKGYPSMQEIP